MRLSALAGLIFVAVSSFSEARGTGLLGTWLTQDGSSKIRFETCGAALCGRLVWLREPNDQQTGKPRIDQNNPEHNKARPTSAGNGRIDQDSSRAAAGMVGERLQP